MCKYRLANPTCTLKNPTQNGVEPHLKSEGSPTENSL